MNRTDGRLLEQRLIGIIRTDDAESAVATADALVAAGLRSIEITLTNPGALPAIAATAAAHPASVIGAGSVLDDTSAVAAVRAGAQFLVTPTVSAGTIAAANRYGVPIIAGAATPTEMLFALELGATAVKLFPASVVGPGWVRDVRAALPQLPIVPTGGVGLDDVIDWLDAGATAVAVGGALCRAVRSNPEAVAGLLRRIEDSAS